MMFMWEGMYYIFQYDIDKAVTQRGKMRLNLIR